MAQENKQEIAFIGLGAMGLPMARNLIDLGYKVTVYNRTAEKAAPLVEAGAVLAASPKEAVTAGGVVMTLVSNDAVLEQIVNHPDTGFLQSLGPDGIHISMSTISPVTAKRMHEQHSRVGCHYVACPVFGRPDAVAAKRMVAVYSGVTPAVEERFLAIMRQLSLKQINFGAEPTAANVTKLCGNYMIAASMQTMSEAFTLAAKNGVDPAQVHALFSQSIFACPIYQNYGRILLNDDPTSDVGFALELGLKDVNLVADTALRSGTPMPIGSLLQQRFMAATAQGMGHADWSAFALLNARDAGLDAEDKIKRCQEYRPAQ
eukprot:TRINITY_DN2904_c0_g1_i2.p1 TRINITY_DN2904_c0_g1~~TRINITY_DN2904_c0_g1_i2.p1  ORF type:complete len:340 (-),score=99.85 TRINITY_DN2904_c0_g1_i2:16-969(-)